MKNTIQYIIFFTLAALVGSCKKAVEIPTPSTSLVGSNVYNDPNTATAVMTGIFGNMHAVSGFADGTAAITTYMGTAADEMVNYYIGIASKQFYQNALSQSPGTYFWAQFFKYIYVANNVIEGVNKSTTLSTDVKQQLLGEAMFARAFMNFYAVNLYGDIPLPLTTDYKVNNVLSRSPQADVYKLIVSDLLASQSMLRDEYKDAGNQITNDRIRPNKAAATALLARAYLYLKDWKNAAIQATSLIENNSYKLEQLSDIFLVGSKEAIWQLPGANTSFTNTTDAYYFVMKTTPGTNHHITLSSFLLNAFETGDKRRTQWVGTFTKGNSTYYYPYKYRNNQTSSTPTEYLIVLRLAEQYLIRAEARAALGESNAKDDLNSIRHRAGLDDYNGPTDKQSLLAAILHERQVELMAEWGHRWFDLKRTGNLDAVMGGSTGVTAAKGGTWKSDWALLPLPVSELTANQNLKQNHGY